MAPTWQQVSEPQCVAHLCRHATILIAVSRVETKDDEHSIPVAVGASV